MDKYLTVMVIPEREKGVKTFRIPRVIFHSFVFIAVISVIMLGILGYDYWKILREVYENKHLTIENRQLKDQIQLFQRKINTLTDDLERIHTFEKKLRIITGLDEMDLSRPLMDDQRPPSHNHSGEGGVDSEIPKDEGHSYNPKPKKNDVLGNPLEKLNAFETQAEYKTLVNIYEQKIASAFGLQTSYAYTKKWSTLTNQSFLLAKDFALFDFQFNELKSVFKDLEVQVHELDQFLLDRDSFLKSMPTLLPSNGWITSYYGPRKNPISGRLKMHEGLDVGAKTGTPIIAPADGIVTYSGRKPGFGNVVELDHGYGLETIYAHANSVKVKKGQRIQRGVIVATVGNTGYSTGPHLHYEVRVNGTTVDPLYFILD
ncbi:MAG: M23 family metallopeptidase [Halobacteriovoraceae bacterium]|nr:M23 family metallopeptidase [Halobacteriovoraceae bacterium]